MDAIKGQADERGQIPNFDSITLDKIDQYLQDARDEGKFVFIADMHGNCHNFLKYSGEYETFEFGAQVKRCIIAKSQSFEDASENTRQALVINMRKGTQMVFHTETMVPDFTKYDGEILPLTDMIFKREKLMTDYMTLVKPDEVYQLGGDLKRHYGQYEMYPEFNIAILMNMSKKIMDDEIV